MPCSSSPATQVLQWVFAAAPGHPALREMCEYIAGAVDSMLGQSNRDTLERTGPGPWTDIILKHARQHPPAAVRSRCQRLWTAGTVCSELAQEAACPGSCVHADHGLLGGPAPVLALVPTWVRCPRAAGWACIWLPGASICAPPAVLPLCRAEWRSCHLGTGACAARRRASP